MIKKFQKSLPAKIALFGLGNAGKSSIVKTLLYEFEAFSSILPTTGVDRTSIDFLGRNLLIWDFGGQSTYRNSYLTNPLMYFQSIRYLYYIIDAQDIDKVDESVEYFTKIFSNCLEFCDDVQIYLFFHKIDPDYDGPVKFPEVEDRFISGIIPSIEATKITPVVFHTSIYKPMTVISAFSQPLLGNQAIYDTLCDAIESFCWEHDLSFGMLFVENYEIGAFYSSDKLKDYVDKRIKQYLSFLDDVEEVPDFKIGQFNLHTEQFTTKVGPKEFLFNFAIGYDPLEVAKEFKGDIEEDLEENLKEDSEDDSVEGLEEIFKSLEDFTDALERILQNAEIIRSGELLIGEIYDKEKLVEIQQRQEELEHLSQMSDEDRQQIILRERELEVIESQRIKFEEEQDAPMDFADSDQDSSSSGNFEEENFDEEEFDEDSDD
ncbi:MAG: ADP-ribosylation factor-like protein [Promethearchaeota archaeon]